MRLGIDFGTTRIVVAASDRGNFPVVSFAAPDGETAEWMPALIALRDGEVLTGWDAWSEQGNPSAALLRSIKRCLGEAGPASVIEVGGEQATVMDLLVALCSGLAAGIRSSLHLGASEPLEAMLGVPANANGNQRFLTAEAFRAAGFEVLGLLNEPSAASIEYGHARRGASGEERRGRILVYDLGGGTFDASLVDIDEARHEVVASEGISSLGGDDFDALLADMALEAAAIDPAGLTEREWFRLHDECRVKKEAIHPNTRRIMIELDAVREAWPEVRIPAEAFEERCQPLIAETLRVVRGLLAGSAPVEAVYVTGGGSDLPAVTRALREEFGRKVRRSAYTRSAAALGLAIQADAAAGYTLRERFTRHFGVWREADSGRALVFDPLFPRDTVLPAAGFAPLTVTRCYAAAHNIGHFRYLECSRTEDHRPAGEVMLWDEILFPFDAELAGRPDLRGVTVERLARPDPPVIEERYSVDVGGRVSVEIANLSSGYSRTYALGRWASGADAIITGKKKRARRTPRA